MWPATSWISSLNRTGSGFRYTLFPAASVTALLLAKLFTMPSNLLVLDEPPTIWMWKRWNCLKSCSPAIQGPVLMVSHDREFLDNLVTTTLALEGDGQVREYVGGYTDWLRQRP